VLADRYGSIVNYRSDIEVQFKLNRGQCLKKSVSTTNH